MEIRFGLSLFLVLFIAWDVHAAVNCTATRAGRFAEPGDTTCRNYTLCVYDRLRNTFLTYNYVCPGTSVFNPTSAQCTAPTNYVCNVTLPISNSSTTTTTTAAPPSTCTADGFVADPSSTDCTSYIQCVNIGGVFTETTYFCPNGTFYNPNNTLCEANYNCIISFNCTSAGRFPDPNDVNCKRYFMCVLANNGTLIQYEYVCPTTSVFSPIARVCTTAYICP